MSSNINYDLTDELNLLKQEEPNSSQISRLNNCFAELENFSRSHDDFLSSYLDAGSFLVAECDNISNEYNSFIKNVEYFSRLWSQTDADEASGSSGDSIWPEGSEAATISIIASDDGNSGGNNSDQSIR